VTGWRHMWKQQRYQFLHIGVFEFVRFKSRVSDKKCIL
jgi:hypothetical protein